MIVVSLVKAEMEGDEEGTKAELSSHVDLGRCPVWRESTEHLPRAFVVICSARDTTSFTQNPFIYYS
jgi:hypothetical protein